MYEVKANKVETFDFKMGYKTYSVPLMRNMPLKKLLEYNKALSKVKPGQESDFLIQFISEIFDEHAPGVTDQLTADQFHDLMQAYIAEGKVSPGESVASSD